MSSDGTAIPGPGADTPNLPNFQVVGQYIKDLSFENPGAPSGLTERPQNSLRTLKIPDQGAFRDFKLQSCWRYAT